MGKKKNSNNNGQKSLHYMAIKKDEDEIRKYEKLLNIKKKKKSFLSDIFSSLDAEFSDDEEAKDDDKKSETDEELNEEEEEIDEEDIEEIGDEDIEEMDDEDGEEMDDEDGEEMDDEDNITDDEIEDISEEVLDSVPNKNKHISKQTKNECVSEIHTKIKRSILQHLNKLCESQMMKCLDGVEEVWSSYPRGEVRDVFIKESQSYIILSCIDFAAFVVCLHVRLFKHTNLLAFYMEHLVDKLSAFNQSNWENERTFGNIMSICKFIAYVTRLEVIDCNLIVDLMTEMSDTFALPQMKVLVEISSIIGFYLRKNSSARCEFFVTTMKEKMCVNLRDCGDISELRSNAHAIVDKLTSSKAKSDVSLESVQKYRKTMRKLCRNQSLSETVALKLADFRGENRVRWWLVGSAIDPNVAHNKCASATADGSHKDETFSEQDQEWNKMAKSLGLSTGGKQALFRILMASKLKEDQADISDVVISVQKLTRSSNGAITVSEGEMVCTIVRCLSLEATFCQFYVNVLATLLESHRRFRILVKCAIWDVLAQPKLVESVRSNCGRCVGQLIAMAGLPINSLKKFNFVDDSPANKAFMISVMTEILEENWSDICELMTEAHKTISVKFIGNLRLFIMKNFKIDEVGTLSRSTVLKVTQCIEMLQELRRSGDKS